MPMPDDPTNLQACDHGFAEWFIPLGAQVFPWLRPRLQHQDVPDDVRRPARVSEHFPGDKYPVYLVDLPWTGRAGKACDEYTWSPVNNTFSARFVFTNRVGLWPANTPDRQRSFFRAWRFQRIPRRSPVFPQPVCRVQRGEQHRA